MQKLHILMILSIVVIIINLSGCSDEKSGDAAASKFETITFDHSIKGWELYSWPDGNNWNYSILTGTNRLKTLNEVTSNKIVVTGTDTLKMLIDKMPAGEELFWISNDWLARTWVNGYGDLSLPDLNLINEIKDYCLHKNLVLTVYP